MRKKRTHIECIISKLYLFSFGYRLLLFSSYFFIRVFAAILFIQRARSGTTWCCAATTMLLISLFQPPRFVVIAVCVRFLQNIMDSRIKRYTPNIYSIRLLSFTIISLIFSCKLKKRKANDTINMKIKSLVCVFSIHLFIEFNSVESRI